MFCTELNEYNVSHQYNTYNNPCHCYYFYEQKIYLIYFPNQESTFFFDENTEKNHLDTGDTQFIVYNMSWLMEVIRKQI